MKKIFPKQSHSTGKNISFSSQGYSDWGWNCHLNNLISASSSTKWGLRTLLLSIKSSLKMNTLNTTRQSDIVIPEKNPNQKLTAKYWGPSVLRPARFPHTEAALICCICCWSCWAIRFCSLSFCVSANFTTMGEEQPCKPQFKQLHTCYPQQSQKYCIKT